jgi:hypothetical protein
MWKFNGEVGLGDGARWGRHDVILASPSTLSAIKSGVSDRHDPAWPRVFARIPSNRQGASVLAGYCYTWICPDVVAGGWIARQLWFTPSLTKTQSYSFLVDERLRFPTPLELSIV